MTAHVQGFGCRPVASYPPVLRAGVREVLPAAGEQARILRKRLVLDSIMGRPIGGSALNRSRTG
jgi:hypothetical protein